MASTYSDLKIELIGTGEQTGTWGSTTNNNFSVAVNEAITGSADVAFSSADVTVGSGCQIEKLYLINNGLADAVTVKNTGGTGIAVPAGKSMFVFNNGTNVVEAVTGAVNLSVGTLAVTGTSTFAGDSTYSGTGQVKLPAGTTAQRSGAPADGMIRYNTDLDSFEGYVDGDWGGIGGAQAGGAILTNKDIASVSFIIPAGENGLSVGPITVNSGITITVTSGQRWVIL